MNRPGNLIERSFWLIRLRWIAIVGVISALLLTFGIFKLSLPYIYLYSIAGILALYNLIFYFILKWIRGRKDGNSFSVINITANLQIGFDLACLAMLIHFSGGIENHFIFYFIFHMIIASILLSRRAAFLQATLAVVLFGAIVYSEYIGTMPHYGLKGFISFSQYKNPSYIIGIFFVFMSTLYIAVYMATSISLRLRQREKMLQEANELLQQKDRLKSEYVLRVSHDIKEHLSAIQGCLDPVLVGITGELNAKQSDLIQRAVQRTTKLLFFVRALLEITRIKLSKELKMESFCVKEAIREAISSVEMRAKGKNVLINFSAAPTVDKVKGAKEYIQETIVNILTNSIKYTPSGGRVHINADDKGDSLLLQIKDTGIGIPKEELPRIFEEFYRASNAKEIEKDGTGLGLSIAKQIIERHKGKIWVESELGKGTTINIILPK